MAVSVDESSPIGATSTKIAPDGNGDLRPYDTSNVGVSTDGNGDLRPYDTSNVGVSTDGNGNLRPYDTSKYGNANKRPYYGASKGFYDEDGATNNGIGTRGSVGAGLP
ncbi:hypothetical protein ABTG41_01790 [Acinetobacter baumannii]